MFFWVSAMDCSTSFSRTCIALTLCVSLFFLQVSAKGCFWNSGCQNIWMGGCRPGFTQLETSNDCKGLCAEPHYPSCPPFFTRFLCCKEGKAMEHADCGQCANKVDVGEEWLCCSDCSEPQITDTDARVGFCQTRASLGSQLKPREVVRWSTREWGKCSTGCGGGLRKRDVKCLRYVEHALHLPAVVNDSECPAATMPAREEACNLTACSGTRLHHKKKRLPIWAIMLISLFTIATAGGLAFAGYLLYKRRTENSNHGFVYVMLEGY